MSIVSQTIQFKLSGKPYEISLWVDDQEMGSLEPAFHNWQVRTDEHTDYDLSQYITSQGHFALTVNKYDHREQLRPYFDQLEKGSDRETIIRQSSSEKECWMSWTKSLTAIIKIVTKTPTIREVKRSF